MVQLPYTKKAVYTAACIALCVVLPMVFHAIPNAGNIWLPMHIPVLLCGLICGWKFGLFCGLAGPFISCILTQMPAVAHLPAMMLELAAYGTASGISANLIKTGNNFWDIEISLVTALISGRIIYGIANALLFQSGSYSISAWITAVFVTALPGIILELLLIPAIIIALQRASLIPYRY